MAALDPKRFSQVGFIVKDIDEARENFAKLFGCEVPPANPCGSPAAKTVYKGEPAPDAKSKLAFFNLVPGVQLELIEPKEWELHPHSSRRTKEMVLLLGCVDNNKTRQLCHQAFYQSEELIYIDSGNGKYTGQVVCGVRRNGHTMRKSIGGVHPEMLKDTDKFPSELSCAEAAQEDPQSIVANVTAATAVLIMVYNILTHGENMALQTDFSTRTIRMQTVLEKQPQTRRNAA